MRVTWLADVLHTANVPVVEHPGWKERGNGELIDVRGLVWHHDASAPGYSPGMADYILHQVAAGMAGANVWVTLDGTWHLIAAGKTYHAGKTLPGKLNNSTSIGVETDHTTGETWSGVYLLESLRIGTAAILRHLGQTVTGLEFHKTICSPVGRKTDPGGLDLTAERRAVSWLFAPQEDDVETKTVTITCKASDGRGYAGTGIPRDKIVAVSPVTGADGTVFKVGLWENPSGSDGTGILHADCGGPTLAQVEVQALVAYRR